ncbi:MAG: hypothetical protein M3394_02430, partial [Actinomycetota bacterium]|nr:hypothetical protein [Actinomycetota bacterium]
MRKSWVVMALVSMVVCGVAQAHDEHEFEPVAELARWRPAPTDQVAFLPLAEGFEDCLPLESACPADSSSLVLVRAGSRPVGWLSAGGELPESTLETPPLRAVGSPPTEPANQRYLVPVLDGEGQSVEHLVRRFEAGRLVPVEPGRLADALHLAPVLIGPVLGGAAPSGESPTRIVEAPVSVSAADLRDAVPALLVRRAPPSRVVFGVRMGNGWLPLVDEHGVALLARHDGRVGLV